MSHPASEARSELACALLSRKATKSLIFAVYYWLTKIYRQHPTVVADSCSANPS